MFPCPCCGFLTIGEQPPGTYEVCPVCFWEHDKVQFEYPDYVGGANKVSLTQAKQNFARFGSASREFLTQVRQPLPNEIPS
jgi:hypothetical protein